MNKTENTDIKKILLACIQAYRENHSDKFDHETAEEHEAYGDTFVSSGRFITDESLKRCEDDFRENFDVDFFITEYLQENDEFRDLIIKLVKGE